MPRKLSAPGARTTDLAAGRLTARGISSGFNGTTPAGGCQWIEREDFLEVIRAGGDPHCGAPRIEGAPYCAKHCRAAFTGRPEIQRSGSEVA